MPCYKPLKGYFAAHLNENGKREILFNPKGAYIDMPVEIACGRCIGCRLENSRQWAIRCVHEAKFHESSCFLTLTYNDLHLPKNLSLEKDIIPKFIKRLRKKYPQKRISYLYCGEYGENFARPHYHICLFGIDFRHDRKKYKQNSLGDWLYNSETLDRLWSKRLTENSEITNIGHAVIGNLTYQSAAYVARYVTKKVSGEEQPKKYGEKVDLSTGELTLLREPEFAQASRRPSLGKKWFEKHYKEIYPNDMVVVNKKPQKPPKYYDTLLERIDPELFKQVKLKRQAGMSEAQTKRPEEFTRERLDVKEQIRSRKKQFLPRRIE